MIAFLIGSSVGIAIGFVLSGMLDPRGADSPLLPCGGCEDDQ